MLNSAQFSPDGKRIVTASGDSTAKVWDANTGKELFSLKGHIDRLNSAQFSPDGNRIVTVSWGNTFKVWDAKTGAELLTLKSTKDVLTPYASANFSPDGHRIVTADGDTANVWDARPYSESFAEREAAEAKR